jgi:hypothetical protein
VNVSGTIVNTIHSWRGFTEACAMELSVVDGNARHIPYTGTWCSLADDDVGGEETEG